ncbi:MAG: PilZ domain-containing protein [Planctomycetia bacterium]|nr:PilZ domain-containing protein [Planctomycetia bacterium]
MPCTLQSDVEFYSMVHEMKRTADATSQANSCRRERSRIPFHCKQWIAPMLGSAVPGDAEFIEVGCRDISTAGFSYINAEVPESNVLSVRLGKTGAWIYLTAEVIRCESTALGEGDGYLMGCKFIGRSPI